MVIRKIQRENLPTLLEFCKAHADLEQSPFDPMAKLERWSQYLFNPGLGIYCWMLELEGELIGYATFMRQFSTWDADFYLYLDCLYLAEHFRGQGFGVQVMQAIKDYAKRKNYSMIQWQTPTFNHGAIAFYKRLGAESKPKERFFWDLS
ncbi:MAG: GNAT family N-acetyltransferase [Saprospiraceae bacterium]|nr:GNAT family N-acetyltransferase [Saprospiraceae bacterium]